MREEETAAVMTRLTEMEALLAKAGATLRREYRRRKEVVFLPWKASAWRSLESIWKAAVEDPDYAVSVVPIPWYYRGPEGDIIEEEHLETEGLPPYVETADYRSFDPEARHPEILIINCPYDRSNYTTVIDPRFFSKRLKGMTEHLVYIPWFVTDEIDSSHPDSAEMYNTRYYVTSPGVVHADLVVVQSEQMRETYVKVLTEAAGEETRGIWAQKIRGFGSPLLDAPRGADYESIPASPIWRQIKEALASGAAAKGGTGHGIS